MKHRRPSTSRSVLKRLLRTFALTNEDRQILSTRLYLMGRGSGDTERFFIDQLPSLLLNGYPDLVPLLMAGLDRVRVRNRNVPFADAQRRFATDS